MMSDDTLGDLFAKPEDSGGTELGMALSLWGLFQTLMSVGFERDEAFDLLLLLLQKGD